MRTPNKSYGFTLLEMVLSVAALTLIVGIGMPVYFQSSVKNDLDVTTGVLAQTIRRAETLAQASDGESPWGVSVVNQKITLFKGATYAARDITYDEAYDVAPSITLSGSSSEIDLAFFTGLPVSSQTFTIASASDAKVVTINAKGMVDYP